MTRYLISFPSGMMDFPEEEGPGVASVAHAVVQEAKDAGAYLFAGCSRVGRKDRGRLPLCARGPGSSCSTRSSDRKRPHG
jgi:hypothetical protein